MVMGEAININEEGALILKKEDSELIKIISGTILQ
jgi:BirA family biotin operon repressor/biotin-[acetyl-CoA-carboxylase] ligase